LRATHRNHVWALDFMHDSTSDGRPIKIMSMCDEFTRKSIGGGVARPIKAEDVVKMLQQAVAERGAPELIRSDNGPEFVAGVIRDWCESNGPTALIG
jgi:putative transposase